MLKQLAGYKGELLYKKSKILSLRYSQFFIPDISPQKILKLLSLTEYGYLQYNTFANTLTAIYLCHSVQCYSDAQMSYKYESTYTTENIKLLHVVKVVVMIRHYDMLMMMLLLLI